MWTFSVVDIVVVVVVCFCRYAAADVGVVTDTNGVIHVVVVDYNLENWCRFDVSCCFFMMRWRFY